MCYISMCSGCSWPICIAPHKYKAPLSFSRKQETLWLQQANQLILCLCECRAKLLRGVREAGNRPSGRTDIEGNQTAVTQCITPISPQHTQR